MEIIALIAGIFLMVIYSALSWGFVGHTFYLWFIHPHFAFLPTFSVIHFVGFMLFATVMFNRTSSTYIKEEYKDKTAMYSALFLAPWVTLVIGWFLKAILM